MRREAEDDEKCNLWPEFEARNSPFNFLRRVSHQTPLVTGFQRQANPLLDSIVERQDSLCQPVITKLYVRVADVDGSQ